MAGSAASTPRRLIVHFTHVRNLPGILAAGSLHADNLVDRGSALVVEAADLEIKNSRRAIQVALPPFGCVADYVPFYFAPLSPMLFKLARGVSPLTPKAKILSYIWYPPSRLSPAPGYGGCSVTATARPP